MRNALYSILALCMITLSGCQAIADIFKAGVWVGILVVVVIIFIVIFLIGRSKK